MKLTRKEVYSLLTEERIYQNNKWTERTTTSTNHHSFEEWLMYMEHYIAIAKHRLSTMPKQEADELVRHDIRKITALGVAAMEDMGAYSRNTKETV